MSANNKTRTIFSCKTCDKGFVTMQDLHKHVSAEGHQPKPNPTVTDYMSTPVRISGESQQMSATNRTRPVYNCKTCDKGFVTNQDLHKHVSAEGHQPKPNPTVTDYMSTPVRISGESQQMSATNRTRPVYNCKTCDKGFVTNQELHKHIRTEGHGSKPKSIVTEPMSTPPVSPKIHKCRWCLSEFPSDSDLNKHLEIKGHYTCDKCNNLRMSTFGEFLQHSSTHEKVPPAGVKSESAPVTGHQINPGAATTFQCQWCLEEFVSKTARNKHYNAQGHHTCPECNDIQKFENRNDLNAHKLEFHPDLVSLPQAQAQAPATSSRTNSRSRKSALVPAGFTARHPQIDITQMSQLDLIKSYENLRLNSTGSSPTYRGIAGKQSAQLTVQTVDSNDSRPMIIHFLVDTSTSMEGTKIKEASEGLVNCMANFEKGYEDMFTLITFATEVKVVYSNLNLEKALESTPSSLLAYGWTSIYGAILKSLEIFKKTPKPKDSLPIMFVLTDGQGTDETLKEKAEKELANPGFKRFHFIQVGVGDDALKVTVPANKDYEYWKIENSKDEIKKMFRKLNTAIRSKRTVRYTKS